MNSHDACVAFEIAPSNPCTTKVAGREGWTLVWCYEGSYKMASVEYRSAFISIAGRSGGCFRCFRKAKQFDQWSLQQTKPFILCTDWREAKPCVQAMTHQARQNWAHSTIVICANEKQKGRAESWLSKLTEWRATVHIEVGFSSIKEIVPSLLPGTLQAFDNSAVTQCFHDGDVQTRQLQATPGYASMQSTVACGKASSLLENIKLEEATCTGEAQGPLATGESQPKDAARMCHAFQQTHFRPYEGQAPQVFSHQLGQAPSAMVMWVWQSVPPAQMAPVWMFDQCPVETEKVLLAALPDIYED